MEGNVAVLLGQVLCVQCVDVDKPGGGNDYSLQQGTGGLIITSSPVQHLELITFHKILGSWSKTEGDEEVF